MKGNSKYLSAFITAALGIGYIAYYMGVEVKGDQYGAIGGAVVMVVEMIIFGLLGLLLLVDQRTKSVGQGILLGAGVALVIGFGICSAV